MKKLILPLWFPPGSNVEWSEGWDSCLNEVLKRLEEAGIPYEMESKFGEGNCTYYNNPENQT